MESEEGAAPGDLSRDGNWRWTGTRWSIRQAEVRGSIVPRVLAWSLLGALPIGSVLGLILGPAASHLNSAAGVIAVLLCLAGAEALVVRIVIRSTPVVTIEEGRVRVGRIGQAKSQSEFPVSEVKTIELMRGSKAAYMWTEGAIGEGKVLIRLTRRSPIELGWDAFSGNASRLAWLLGVPLVDSAHKPAKGKPTRSSTPGKAPHD